jgi:hypothetical protein
MIVLYGAGAALAAYIAYQLYYYGSVAGVALGDALNPFNRNNAIATGVDKGLQTLGVIGPDDSLGTAIYGAVHDVPIVPGVTSIAAGALAPVGSDPNQAKPGAGASPANGSLIPGVPGAAAGGAPAVTLPGGTDPGVSIIFGGGA